MFIYVILQVWLLALSSASICPAPAEQGSMPGNVSLTALLTLREGEECERVSLHGVQTLATIRMTILKINAGGIVPGIGIGLSVYDTCSRSDVAVRAALASIVASGSSTCRGAPDLLGFFGPTEIDILTKVQKVSRTFGLNHIVPTLPRIGGLHTYDALPVSWIDLDVRAKTVLKVLKDLNMTSLPVIHTSDNVARHLAAKLFARSSASLVCIPTSTEISSKQFGEAYTQKLLKKVYSASGNSSAVLLIGAANELIRFLQSVQEDTFSKNSFNTFVVLGSLGPYPETSLPNLKHYNIVILRDSVQTELASVSNAVSNSLRFPPAPIFGDYVAQVCGVPKNGPTVTKTCGVASELFERNFEEEPSVGEPVVSALYLMAEALREAHHDMCGDISGVCAKLRNQNPVRWHSHYLRHAKHRFTTEEFPELAGTLVQFQQTESKPGFSVLVRTANGKLIVKVATHSTDEGTKFASGYLLPAPSLCSEKCKCGASDAEDLETVKKEDPEVEKADEDAAKEEDNEETADDKDVADHEDEEEDEEYDLKVNEDIVEEADEQNVVDKDETEIKVKEDFEDPDDNTYSTSRDHNLMNGRHPKGIFDPKMKTMGQAQFLAILTGFAVGLFIVIGVCMYGLFRSIVGRQRQDRESSRSS